ncbi:hypothetical protein F5880DRAFT_1122134 [Lentinula raphanica]|nr:hypothetical protein F5880DRAFT_1122134 [Lentinula raphanica]
MAGRNKKKGLNHQYLFLQSWSPLNVVVSALFFLQNPYAMVNILFVIVISSHLYQMWATSVLAAPGRGKNRSKDRLAEDRSRNWSSWNRSSQYSWNQDWSRDRSTGQHPPSQDRSINQPSIPRLRIARAIGQFSIPRLGIARVKIGREIGQLSIPRLRIDRVGIGRAIGQPSIPRLRIVQGIGRAIDQLIAPLGIAQVRVGQVSIAHPRIAREIGRLVARARLRIGREIDRSNQYPPPQDQSKKMDVGASTSSDMHQSSRHRPDSTVQNADKAQNEGKAHQVEMHPDDAEYPIKDIIEVDFLHRDPTISQVVDLYGPDLCYDMVEDILQVIESRKPGEGSRQERIR